MVYACACVCVHHATRPPMRARALPFGAPTGGACRRETLRGPPAPHRGGSGGEGGAPIDSDRLGSAEARRAPRWLHGRAFAVASTSGARSTSTCEFECLVHLVRHVDVGPLVEQQPDDLEVAVLGGDEEGRGSVLREREIEVGGGSGMGVDAEWASHHHYYIYIYIYIYNITPK